MLGNYIKKLGNYIKTLGNYIKTLGSYIKKLGIYIKKLGNYIKTLSWLTIKEVVGFDESQTPNFGSHTPKLIHRSIKCETAITFDMWQLSHVSQKPRHIKGCRRDI